MSTGACSLGVPGSNPCRGGYLSSWLCICSAPNCSKTWSAAYGTVHYKEPLKSFEIKVGQSPGFELPSVAILPRLCRKRRKAIFIFWPPGSSSLQMQRAFFCIMHDEGDQIITPENSIYSKVTEETRPVI